MQYRSLGRTGFHVSTVSVGCWAIGGAWGKINDQESLAALHRSLDLGVNFFDTAAGYDAGNLTRFVERSLTNLRVDALDLLQLHCPPTDVYYQPETFGALDELVRVGKLRHYGVSVERVEEGLKALEYPNVKSIQIIFNIFRQRPLELLFKEAARRKVGILARVPLASGLLTGKLTRQQSFEADDHRQFNRHGEAFDRGETFAGV